MLKMRVKKRGTAKKLPTTGQQGAQQVSEPGLGGVIYVFSMYKAYLSDLRPKGLGGYIVVVVVVYSDT